MNDSIHPTKNYAHKIKSRKKIQWLYRWHKKIGLFFCLWLILLAITGILLNHTEDLSLNQRPIQSHWLLDWHDITVPDHALSFMISKEKTMTQIENIVFLNDQTITESSDPIIGSITIDHLEMPMMVIAFNTHLERLTEDGEKIDTLPLDFSAKKIGLFNDNKGNSTCIIETSDGNYLYSQDFTEWKSMQQSPSTHLEKAPFPVILPAIHWSHSISLTDEQLQKVQKQYRQTQLSWEKVILSLHNGYFFGSIGKWLTDLWGIFALLISITGLYLWQQKETMKIFDHKIPPPIVAILFGYIMWLGSGGILTHENMSVIRLILASTTFISGMFFYLSGVIALRKAKTTVNPLKPESASSLVASGIYKISRNPIYVGFALSLIAWMFWLQSLWSFFGVVAFIIYIDRFQIAPEERAMHALFVYAFGNYKKQVRRWL